MYLGQCPSIPAQAVRKRRSFIRHIYLVDLFAGAGLHLRASHPDGAVAGTAVLAARSARRIAQKYKEVEVHVRLVDINDDYCEKLARRTSAFRNQGIDVQVLRGSYENQIAALIEASNLHQGRNFFLWFFDPFGIKALDRKFFNPIEAAGPGHEIIINLDVGALFRIRAASNVLSGDGDLLDLAFGDRSWDSAYGSSNGSWDRAEFDRLARAYADTFTKSGFLTATYPLRSSENQIRYLVHLARNTVAIEALAKSYRASQKIKLYQGTALTPTDKAHLIEQIFPQVRGERMTVDDMHDAQLLPINKNQLRVILREADDLMYGTFNEGTGEIQWFPKRTRPIGIESTRSRRLTSQVELF